MPIKFTIPEREALKIQMFHAGLEILKEYGMKHTSVDKITQAVGIGRSTFYNFFGSKEVFIYELMLYQRDKAKKRFNDLIKEKQVLTVEDCKEYFIEMFNSETVYQYLTVEDEFILSEKLGVETVFNPQEDSETIDMMLGYMEGVKADFDKSVLLNMIKICAIAKESKELLYRDSLDKTINLILDKAFEDISDM